MPNDDDLLRAQLCQKDVEIQSLNEIIFALRRRRNSNYELSEMVSDMQLVDQRNQNQINITDIIKCILTEKDVLQAACDINDGRIPGTSRFEDLKPKESFDEYVEESTKLVAEEKQMNEFMDLYPDDTDSEDVGGWYGDDGSDVSEDDQRRLLLMSRIESVIENVFAGTDDSSSDVQMEVEFDDEDDDEDAATDEKPIQLEDCDDPQCGICESGGTFLFQYEQSEFAQQSPVIPELFN
jgi:hypothetical protein